MILVRAGRAGSLHRGWGERAATAADPNLVVTKGGQPIARRRPFMNAVCSICSLAIRNRPNTYRCHISVESLLLLERQLLPCDE